MRHARQDLWHTLGMLFKPSMILAAHPAALSAQHCKISTAFVLMPMTGWHEVFSIDHSLYGNSRHDLPFSHSTRHIQHQDVMCAFCLTEA